MTELCIWLLLMIFVADFFIQQCCKIIHYDYRWTSGFWPRVRARALRAPAKLGLLTCQTGRCAPLAHGSFAASYTSPKNNYFQKQIASLLAQTRALPIAASLILSAIFWGQNVLVRPYALTFLGFSFFV
jgi:hypothetical protein